jgi:cholesterol transport system auxiliary component
VKGRLASALALVALAAVPACSLKPKPRAPVALHDLRARGELVDLAGPRLEAGFLVREPGAPPWLDTTALHYRLEYDDPSRLRRYAQSRWATPPARLFGDLLRRRLAALSSKGALSELDGGAADYALSVELEEFAQAFDTPASSRGVVRLRATLIALPSRRVAGQRSFHLAHPAPTPDAPGGVQALANASQQAAGEVVAWIAEILARSTPVAAPGLPPSG